MNKRLLILAATAVAFAFPAPASAQVGGLINRAKKAAIDDATTKPAGSDSRIGDPFDAPSLDAAMKGMRVFKVKTADIASLRTQYLANQNRRQELSDKNERVIHDYEVNNDKIRDCIAEQINVINEGRRNTMAQQAMTVLSDPAKAQEYTALIQAQTAAATKNDTAAMRKIGIDVMKLFGMDPKLDTATAAKKCGNLPAKPAPMVEMERLAKLTDTLNVRIRTAESMSDIEAARAAGVSPARFAQMRERLERYWAKPAAFPGKEGDLLKGQKSEIEGFFKTS